ncbi:hypothetical protein JW962_02205 [Candidatus Dojkabacteria bacterium]|nr:hypothetical protein [Candidatus Dojkabacteria bacterium]
MYTKKSVDVWALFTDSIKFILKYKALWVIGFVFALFYMQGGTSSGGLSSQLNASNDKSGLEVIMKELPSSVRGRISDAVIEWKETFSSVSIIVLILSLGCLGLLFGLLGVYIRIVARNAIIRATVSETKSGLIELWKSGHKGFWEVFIVDFLYGVMEFILVALSLPLICLCGVGILTIIFGSISIHWIYVTAIRLIVLKDKGVMESINDAWEIISQNISNYIVWALLNWALGAIKGIIFLVVFGIGFIVFIVTFGVVFAIGFHLLSILAMILLVAIAWIVSALFNTLFILQEEVFATKLVKELAE